MDDRDQLVRIHERIKLRVMVEFSLAAMRRAKPVYDTTEGLFHTLYERVWNRILFDDLDDVVGARILR